MNTKESKVELIKLFKVDKIKLKQKYSIKIKFWIW